MSKTSISRQFWIRAPGSGEIRTAPLAPPGADEVLVRALFSGISRGTESLVFKGDVPASQAGVMRAPFQEGDFPGPLKYGYASVGQVLEKGSGAGPDLVGRRVFCLFPHQDLYVVPATAVFALPDEVPPERAVLAANLETAVNGVWDAPPGPGDKVVVIGAGVVGLMVAWLCGRIPGTEVMVVDPDPSRAGPARALGLNFQQRPPEAADADLVVHASGSPEGLAVALELAGVEAKVLELSWYGTRTVPLALGEAFHSRRLTLKSSQVGRIPPERAPRWTHARRLALALELLKDPRLDVLITGESRFDELPEVMARLSRDGAGVLLHRVRY